MTAERFLYCLALGLMVYALFILMIWTGPVGLLIAGGAVHGILALAERSPDRHIPEPVPEAKFNPQQHWRH